MMEDPFTKEHPERDLPKTKQPENSTEVVNETKEYRDLRKLAELAGGPIDQLKEI